MDVKHDISTLKEQGLTDKDAVMLLRLKGRNEDVIQRGLQKYYKNKSATQLGHSEKSSGNYTTAILSVITILLFIIFVVLTWMIVSQ